MALRLRVPTLVLALLSLVINLAILACAARTLHLFNSHKRTSPYFLPVWSGHFETRQLDALIGTSTVIVILNGIFAGGLFIASRLAGFLTLASAALSLILSLLALSWSSVLNRSAERDTLQTWTCMWKDVPGEDVPSDFGTMCQQTRFAFYTTIPSFIIQLLLLFLAIYAFFTARRNPYGTTKIRGMGFEKDHELGGMSGDSRRQDSWDHEDERKSRGSPELEADGRVRVLAGKE